MEKKRKENNIKWANIKWNKIKSSLYVSPVSWSDPQSHWCNCNSFKTTSYYLIAFVTFGYISNERFIEQDIDITEVKDSSLLKYCQLILEFQAQIYRTTSGTWLL